MIGLKKQSKGRPVIQIYCSLLSHRNFSLESMLHALSFITGPPGFQNPAPVAQNTYIYLYTLQCVSSS